MKKFLVVVDMQKDFVDGSLGSAEATAIVPNVVNKINAFDGDIFVTLDTHTEDYMNTAEGKKLPILHCVRGTAGWELDARIANALDGRSFTTVEKTTFGSIALPELIRKAANDEDFSIEIVGLCTDICVISNALLLKAHFPEKTIAVDTACCAGVMHNAALIIMRNCQIDCYRGVG